MTDLSDERVVRPTDVESIQEIVRRAKRDRLAVRPVGRSTASESVDHRPVWNSLRFTDDRPVIRLEMTGLDGPIEHAYDDLTITTAAGVRLDQLAQITSSRGQTLPLDVPGVSVVSSRAVDRPSGETTPTVGDLIAADLHGGRRFCYGRVRDYLIGIEFVDATGRVVHAGGRVVKNVAGYDLMKLLIGSRGSLGIVTRATFKLKPIQPARAVTTGVVDFESLGRLIAGFTNARVRPTAFDVEPIKAGSRSLRVELYVEECDLAVIEQSKRFASFLAEVGADSINTTIGDDAVVSLDRRSALGDDSSFDWSFECSCLSTRVPAALAAIQATGDELGGRSVVSFAHVGDGCVRAFGSSDLVEPIQWLRGFFGRTIADQDSANRIIDRFQGEETRPEEVRSALDKAGVGGLRLFRKRTKQSSVEVGRPIRISADDGGDYARRIKRYFDPDGIFGSIV